MLVLQIWSSFLFTYLFVGELLTGMYRVGTMVVQRSRRWANGIQH